MRRLTRNEKMVLVAIVAIAITIVYLSNRGISDCWRVRFIGNSTYFTDLRINLE